ncbi:MAG: metallophosphoesterase family protein [Bacteroidaceae bacterium]|nr:metallophosphoesterase family protein [Bacteroidaceae bacterium]
MNRRDFLRTSALISMNGVASTLPAVESEASTGSVPDGDIARRFTFNKDGKFKILQLTDTHYISGDKRSERALKNVCEMLDAERPDLVIHTGDVIFGKPAEPSLREILAPIVDRKIPFAVALGNHDGEYDKNRHEVMDLIRTIPYNINKGVEGITGDSNDIITLSAAGGGPQWVFYLFDSGNWIGREDMKGYDYIHFDQIAWYRNRSEAFTQQNGGKPIPSLAFFHIPVPEYTYATRYEAHRIFKGNMGEDPGCSKVNSGLFVSMKEMGDIKAIVCGHEHDNDYALKWRDMFLMYGRFSGCDTVYNNLKPNGARIFEFTAGQQGFRSWIRLFGGKVEQNLSYPESFKTY